MSRESARAVATGTHPTVPRDRTRQVTVSVGCPLCHTYEHTPDVCPRRAVRPPQAAADGILRMALHLRMNGERAPGGSETWAAFDRRLEEYLRRSLCADRGFHTPGEPECPDCRTVGT